VAILQIRTVPDPVLRRVSDPVSDFDDGVGQLANDMLQTMYAATGRGIAAPLTRLRRWTKGACRSLIKPSRSRAQQR